MMQAGDEQTELEIVVPVMLSGSATVSPFKKRVFSFGSIFMVDVCDFIFPFDSRGELVTLLRRVALVGDMKELYLLRPGEMEVLEFCRAEVDEWLAISAFVL
jgi:hypothetical protein